MTNSKTIRWGIAGTGVIAGQFAHDIRHAAGATLSAVTARDPAKAAAFARQHSLAAGFSSLSAMIGSGRIDAVYIATPNTVHCAQTLECIAARIPVLVEKPLTASLTQAREIETAARAAGSFVMEAMWSRYLPAVQAARTAIRDGVIGTVTRLEAELAWKIDYDPQSRFFDKANGGGALHDLGVYPISLARFLLGEPTQITGSWRPAPSGVDIAAEISMHFGQTEALIRCGFDRTGANRMIIEGDRGVISLGVPFIKAGAYTVFASRRRADFTEPGGDTRMARIRRKLFRHMPLPGVSRHDYPFPGSGLQFEIEAASDAIRQNWNEHPDNRLGDSLATLRIIDDVLAAPPSGT
ncbi:Gfo/Idh/MocA family oxidoreductase [Hoeflea sp. G2-23]|uniref:Gfo/Idh/MocA family oxidoreductase n=1 Tax=Hoeflea algicola TaxID=2983763 RepID=A0ABT3Z8J3_9HYPH|nr:Gfo/Idh/MocA family oxidoreductase [Hoeflea algicola]MCY0148104.1 Gfo/Idh/MocA family oxidoreductase [Hoeflea algicola]